MPNKAYKFAIIAGLLILVLSITVNISYAMKQSSASDDGYLTRVAVSINLYEYDAVAVSTHSFYVKSFNGHPITAHYILITDNGEVGYVRLLTKTNQWYTWHIIGQNTYNAKAISYTLIEDEAEVDAFAETSVSA